MNTAEETNSLKQGNGKVNTSQKAKFRDRR
jgi:hypothetical protein